MVEFPFGASNLNDFRTDAEVHVAFPSKKPAQRIESCRTKDVISRGIRRLLATTTIHYTVYQGQKQKKVLRKGGLGCAAAHEA